MATVTAMVTGKIGPGGTLTAASISGITSFSFNPTACLFTYSQGGTINHIDISAATTITITLSGAAGNYTLTIS